MKEIIHAWNHDKVPADVTGGKKKICWIGKIFWIKKTF